MLITSCQLFNCHFSGYWRSHHAEMLIANSTGFILYFWPLFVTYASLVALPVKNWPAMWEIQVRFLGWEGPLAKGMATHFSILHWKISWTEEPGWLQSMGSQRVGHDWATNTHSQAPGVDDGQGGLACCSSWCCKDLDRTEPLIWTETENISLEVFLSVAFNKKDE